MPCAVGPRRARLWRCCARWPVVVEAPRSMVFNDQEPGMLCCAMLDKWGIEKSL